MIADFSGLAQHIGSYRLKWSSEISFDKDQLLYRVKPSMDWRFTLCYETQISSDSLWYKELKNKYEATYSYNLLTGETIAVDTTLIQPINNGYAAELSDVKNLLNNVPAIQLGFDLTEIYPRPEQAYIE